MYHGTIAASAALAMIRPLACSDPACTIATLAAKTTA
jgi:hypothetical protein